MVNRLLIIWLLGMSTVIITRSEAKAQYNYFGGGWEFCVFDPDINNFVCSYHHKMIFTGVPGKDVKDGEVLFVSRALWFDNAFSCCVGKNCQNEPFNPGLGHIATEGKVLAALDQACIKQGKCSGTVVYPSSADELNNPELYNSFCNAGETAQQCFTRVLDLGNIHCRNKNDTVTRVSTKGVCATANAESCDASGCTLQRTVGLLLTFPSFEQKRGDSFAVRRDDTCITCVESGGVKGCPAP